MILKKLKDFFHPDDIEWRVQQSGATKKGPWALVLAYVTNRAIMDRLDDVCGPENWQNEYRTGPAGGIICGLSIKAGAEWVTKWDGADNTEIEKVKGGLSASMKRAAVQWGIGRYLYKLPEGFAIFSDSGKFKAKIKDLNGNYHYMKWNPPAFPKWAIPEMGV